MTAAGSTKRGTRRPGRDQAPILAAALWLSIYLLVVTAPLFALLADPQVGGSGFAWDFAMALGYAALAMLGIQFVLTARFRRATAPFGIDIVYHFHRYLAIAATLLVIVHYGILRVDLPAALGSASPTVAPLHMTAGRLSLLLFAAVAVMALCRRVLRLEYDRWRIVHSALSIAAFALAMFHVFGAGRYLDTGWKRGLWAGYGGIWLLLIAHVRLWRPWQLLRRPYRVQTIRPESCDVWTLVLEPTRSPPLTFSPGQFVWLTLGASPFAMREHPFSIASSAEHPERIELSIKELGDFTATIKHVQPGAIAYVDGCYGTFGIDHHPGAPGFVFIAGGIGIAPILSMLRTMADRGDRRPCLLIYGNWQHERTAFLGELERLTTRLDLRIVHVLQEPPPDWTGEPGLITRELLQRHLPTDYALRVYFVCGPTPMIESVEHGLNGLGVPPTRVHAELFDWV